MGSLEPLVYMQLQLQVVCALSTCIVFVHCLGHRLGKRVGAEYRPDAFRRSGWEYPRCEYWTAPCRNMGRFQCGCLGLLGATCSYAVVVVSTVCTVYLHCVCTLPRAQAEKVSGSRNTGRTPSCALTGNTPIVSTSRSLARIRVGFNVDTLGSSEPLLKLYL